MAMSDSSYHALRFDPALCDGCLACVRECPTVALTLRPEGQAGSRRARSTERPAA